MRVQFCNCINTPTELLFQDNFPLHFGNLHIQNKARACYWHLRPTGERASKEQMATKIFNTLEEMAPFWLTQYPASQNYEFIENGKRLDIIINFELAINGNIKAGNITALNISVRNINAGHINASHITAHGIRSGNIHARDITADYIFSGNIDADRITAKHLDAQNVHAYAIEAHDIFFHAVCYTYNNIVCKNIRGLREDSKYFSLDGKVIIETEDEKK